MTTSSSVPERGRRRRRASERERQGTACSAWRPARPARRYFWSRPPTGSLFMFSNPKVNWCYYSEPDPSHGNRPMFVPRGKMLGGTTSINGMIYNRGQRVDYDTWASSRLPRLGLRRRAAVLQEDREHADRLGPLSRPRRPDQGDRSAERLALLRPVHARGQRRRHPEQLRLQRRVAGRHRVRAADRVSRHAPQHRDRLPGAGAQAAATSRSSPARKRPSS